MCAAVTDVPHVVCFEQAEEAHPEEEVRPAVQLRRLRGDGGGGERRGRHAVRSSQPPQVRGQLTATNTQHTAR